MDTKPTSLMIAALALVGWILAAYLWSELSDLRGQMVAALKGAEMARSGLAADFQNLQVANGDLESVRRKADAAKTDFENATKAAADQDANAKTLEAKIAALQGDFAAKSAAMEATARDLHDLEARRALAESDAAESARQAEVAAQNLKDLHTKINAVGADLAALTEKIERAKAAQSAPAQ
jgi:chromosome segregation ATPase